MKIVVFASLFMLGCSNLEVASQLIPLPYDLASPMESIVLPPVLREVSGIVSCDSVTVACVQDENGIVFFYDLRKKRIARQLVFGYDGDYESITRDGTKLFVLRSDGVLYEIPDLNDESANTIHHRTNVPALNNEGLFHDKASNRLLIASKGKVEEEERDERHVYAFDLEQKKLLPRPVLNFSTIDITQFAVDHKMHEPYRLTSKGKSVPNLLKVRTSEIAVHPLTGHIYMLAAADHLLLVFTAEGKIIHLQKLDPAVFNQAEGLTFLENGDMLISNEGGEGGEPTLLWFRYKEK